jgi:hypothetical protein
MKENGQIVLLLILVMTVALAIGLSIVQKSLVDISTASKVEESSRAFSAAEAGVEKALKGDTSLQSFADNASIIRQISDSGLIPAIPAVGTQQAALEYPALAKEDTAHVWLADLNSITSPPAAFYTQTTLDVYWGSSATDKTALELTLVYYGTNPADLIDPSTTKYRSRKWYLDDISAVRSSPNGFDTVACPSNQCRKTLGDGTGVNNSSLPSGAPNILMLIRARLLYNTTSQPFSVQATGTCGAACSLPPQARSIFSTGSSGETQRTVNVFQLNKVVLPLFDYAIFSAGEITK